MNYSMAASVDGKTLDSLVKATLDDLGIDYEHKVDYGRVHPDSIGIASYSWSEDAYTGNQNLDKETLDYLADSDILKNERNFKISIIKSDEAYMDSIPLSCDLPEWDKNSDNREQRVRSKLHDTINKYLDPERDQQLVPHRFNKNIQNHLDSGHGSL